MDEVMELISEQVADEALWLEPRDPQAVVLQQELRMLHDAVRRARERGDE